MNLAIILVGVLLVLVCIYRSVGLKMWTVITGLYLLILTLIGWLTGAACITLWAIYLPVAIFLNIPQIRKAAVSGPLLKAFAKTMPKLSSTEETALNAGDTWVEQDLFRGEPNWNRVHGIPKHVMSDEEQAFLDNETNELCAMVDDWDVMQKRDLPENVWKFIKDKGFFGLVIDKKYGGKGFSAKAHSEIVMKICSRSPTAAVTVMVPNSLGPGELLHHYGTQEQKDQFLPGLASGKQVPCFALTEPGAGSDATSISSTGIVCEDEFEGKKTLGLKLTFNKRYITLAPVATLVGLAIDLQDPNGLLNGVGTEGITCLLIPRDTKGLEIGNRHYPATLPFMNGTIRGEDIFVPIDYIIGGQKMAGEGWRMLVECLSIGRSISLPANGTACASVSYLTTGAYSLLRKQFGIHIGGFEGIEEVLANISGLSYIINATREMTVAAVDAGIKPSVASAIAKMHNTEKARETIKGAMDVHSGRGVVIGPRNYLAAGYQGAPVSITVEGANIMTRNLLIFGQGAMACHPYIRKEFYAVNEGNVDKFDGILWSHAGYLLRNTVRSLWAGLTCGAFICAPSSPLKKYYKRVARLSYNFAYVSDVSLMYLGGELKRKERLSARLGDALAHLYMAAAVLKQFKDYGEHSDEVIYAKWALEYCLHETQKGLCGLTSNFPSKVLGSVMRFLMFPVGGVYKGPTDKLDAQVASSSMKNNAYRDRLLSRLYFSGDSEQPLDRVENAFQAVLNSAGATKKIYKAIKEKTLPKLPIEEILEIALEKSVISEAEYEQLSAAEAARWDAVQVDEFEPKELLSKGIKAYQLKPKARKTVTKMPKVEKAKAEEKSKSDSRTADMKTNDKSVEEQLND